MTVNNITGSCYSNNCSFNYSSEHTPKITSVSPTSGSGGPPGIGTVITINGSGFSSEIDLNTVMIGGSNCSIIDSTEETLTCRTGIYSFTYCNKQSIVIFEVIGKERKVHFRYSPYIYQFLQLKQMFLTLFYCSPKRRQVQRRG